MANAIPEYTVIQYVRKRNRIPYGVIVAIKSESGYEIGFSLCNKADRFSKEMALKIAIGRAQIKDDVRPVPRPIAKVITAFVKRCDKYYKIGNHDKAAS